MKFHRYGALNAKHTRHRTMGVRFGVETDSFHAPPTPRGLYAMPADVNDPFLWGWRYKLSAAAKRRLAGLVGDAREQAERAEWRRAARADHRHFEYSGELWHHLGDYCPNHAVLARHGSWVLTSTRAFAKARAKAEATLRAEGFHRGAPADLLEVFIEGNCASRIR